MDIELKNRNLLTLADFSPNEIYSLLEFSHYLKRLKKANEETPFLTGKNIALIFEKTSTRTRCAFEVAAYDQRANVTYLGPTGSQLGHKETMKDTARVLGRMYDGIEYRGYDQHIVEELAKYAGVPVWNGLTTEYHPTQVLADIMTMMEFTGKDPGDISFCYMGDAHNNTCNSLMIGASKMGMDFRIASPGDFQPDQQLTAYCQETAATNGGNITITEDIPGALKHVDFIYTDVWVSMGENEEVWKDRIHKLTPYQVNREKLDMTLNDQVKFLHCLPAFHNRDTQIGEEIYKQYGLESLEVTEDVFESEHSVVFDQSENRIHTIKAVMVATLGRD